MAGSEPLTLVTAYSCASNPKCFSKVFLEQPGAITLYLDYLKQRDALDRRFWEQTRNLPETQRAAVSLGMAHEPAYKELRAIHDSIEALGKL